MTREDLGNTITSYFNTYQPATPTGEGSAFQTQFLDKLLDYLGADEYNDSTMKFVRDRLVEAFPDLAVGAEGGGLVDLMVKVPSVLLEMPRRTLHQLRLERAGLAAPTYLTPDSANDLAGNFFMERSLAGYSTVDVTLYFAAPTNVILFVENTARTATGLRFVPIIVTEVRAEIMQNQRQGSLYWYKVTFVAENPGSANQIDAGEIFIVDGVPGLVKATNFEQSTRVNDDETPVDLAVRSQDSITERSQVIKRGISTVIASTLAGVSDVQVIGFNDPEMQRDLLTATVQYSDQGNQPTLLVAAGEAAEPQPTFEGDMSSVPYTTSLELWRDEAMTELYEPESTDAYQAITAKGADRHVTEVDHDAGLVRTDDFATIYEGSVETSGDGFPVDGGSPLITFPAASLSSDVVTAEDDVILVWEPPAAYSEGSYAWLRGGSGQQAWFRGEYRAAASGETGVAVTYLAAGWLKVPGRLSWPADPDKTYLTIQRTTPSNPQWVEFIGADHVLDIQVDAPGHEGYTLISVPVLATHGWAEGNTGTIASNPPGLVIGETYLWTLWTHTTDSSLPRVETRFSTFMGMGVILRIQDVDTDDPLSSLLNVNDDPYVWALREAAAPESSVISVSDIPGGILFPDVSPSEDAPNGKLLVPANQVHLGGKVDVHVFPGAEYGESTSAIDVLSDYDVLVRGTDMTWGEGNVVWSAQLAAVADDRSSYFPISISVWNEPGHTIFNVVESLGGGEFLVDTEFSQAQLSGASFTASAGTLRYSLSDPRNVKAFGSDLATASYDRSVVTTSKVDSSADAAVGDFLRVLTNGPNKGDYEIVGVSAGSLELAARMPSAASGMSFQVFTRQEKFVLPVVRAKSVVLTNGGVDIAIPHGPPVGTLVYRDFHDGKGTVRSYFLDKTVFFLPKYSGEDVKLSRGSAHFGFDGESVCYSTDEDSDLRFATTSTLTTQARVDKGIPGAGGMNMRINYKPLVGSVQFTEEDSPVSVGGLTLALRVNSGVVRTMTFNPGSGGLNLPLSDANSPGGVCQQIEAFFTGVKATAVEDDDNKFRLQLMCAQKLEVGSCTADTLLGISGSNVSSNAGTVFTVSSAAYDGDKVTVTVSPSVVEETAEWSGGYLAEFYTTDGIFYPASMSLDTELGLYYYEYDVRYVSGETLSEEHNLVRGDSLDVSTLLSFGYRLESNNPTTSFSTADDLDLVVSTVFAHEATADLTGPWFHTKDQAVTVTNEVCSVTADVNDLLRADPQRVAVADPLARTALPVWVLGKVSYFNGELDTVVLPYLSSYIRAVKFGGYLDISDVRSVFQRFGATDFVDPTRLFAMRLTASRVWGMSELLDRLTFDRVYHFLPDSERLTAARLQGA